MRWEWWQRETAGEVGGLGDLLGLDQLGVDLMAVVDCYGEGSGWRCHPLPL